MTKHAFYGIAICMKQLCSPKTTACHLRGKGSTFPLLKNRQCDEKRASASNNTSGLGMTNGNGHNAAAKPASPCVSVAARLKPRPDTNLYSPDVGFDVTDVTPSRVRSPLESSNRENVPSDIRHS
jgi:hypothetical protein